MAVVVGLGTLYVAYLFIGAARRVPHGSPQDGTERATRSRTRRSVGRAALVCFVFGLAGLFVPIGTVSASARVVAGVVLVLGTLIGAAALVDARNATPADDAKE